MSDILLIGVDGGATEVKAHAVDCDDLAQPKSFTLGTNHAARLYPVLGRFEPLPVTQQLQERDSGELRLTDEEVEQGRLWVESASEAIREVAQTAGGMRLVIGIGMPGLKTPDGRGICVMNNGPRIPSYVADLECRLVQAGFQLATPIAALGSDADYCGLGEEYAAEGLFRDVRHAYFAGCGTGIADALKLNGELLPFDQTKDWLLKSWQICSALGPTFEKLVSARSLNQIFARLMPRGTDHSPAAGAPRPGTPASQISSDSPRRGSEKSPSDQPRVSPYPERAALEGGLLLAHSWLDTAALVLAELLFERIWTLCNGRANVAHRGDAYLRLQSDHPYRGAVLDRLIVGQRLGQIYSDPAYRPLFAEKLEAYLAAFIAMSADHGLVQAYLADGRLRPGLLRASRLRAAPALGAAVAAVRAWNAGSRSKQTR